MSILDTLERKFGRYAVRHLIAFIVGMNALVYMLRLTMPESSAPGMLALEPGLILKGEVWRLVTWVFIPPSASLLWIVFVLYFTYMIGTGLEQEWGSFRFNIYYLIGMAATAAAAFITGQSASALYLNLSLFLAFAYLYPDFEVLLFFILPVKIKYFAWLNWAFIGFTVLTAPLPARLAALVSVSNFFLFFGPEIFDNTKRRSSSSRRRREFGQAFEPPRQKASVHRCTVCGMTEQDDASMEFRYCSACAGDHEYCMAHLKEHDHIRQP